MNGKQLFEAKSDNYSLTYVYDEVYNTIIQGVNMNDMRFGDLPVDLQPSTLA